MTIYDRLKKLTHKQQMRFGLFSALQVKHLMKDERSLTALVKLDLFIKDEISLDEMKNAYADAYVAAYAYVAADADAYVAAYVAYAAAYVAADADAAAYVAADALVAAYAYVAADADAAAKKQIREKQLEYLKELENESKI